MFDVMMNGSGEMMSGMMSGMMLGMGALCLLVPVILILAIAGLIKYLFFKN